MPKVKVFNMAGESVGTLNLKDEVFAVEENLPLIHEVVVAYNANQRQGTKSTLTRSEVRGHAKKPYRQKHTGNARQGSTKAPHQTGGGVAFAPKPRDFSKKINKQAKRLAFLSALSTKLAQNEITVVDEFKLNEVKTKEIQNFLNAFKFDKSVVLVTEDKNEDVLRAGANIPTVSVTTADLLNTYEVVANKNVVLTKAAIKSIEEAYAE
ncbi:MAG: 50S ribosomal protein L4 [Christensenellales bacterium]